MVIDVLKTILDNDKDFLDSCRITSPSVAEKAVSYHVNPCFNTLDALYTALTSDDLLKICYRLALTCEPDIAMDLLKELYRESRFSGDAVFLITHGINGIKNAPIPDPVIESFIDFINFDI